MVRITKKDVFKYTLMPQVRPRVKELFVSGFQFIPFFMALVYRAVGLIPNNHPYLKQENLGRYGVRHVMAQAANNLVFSKNNIDQIILFFTVMIGAFLIVAQVLLLLFGLAVGPVLAAMPTNFRELFLTPTANEDQDLAHILLDLVFGVPNTDASGTVTGSIFNSCVSRPLVPCVNQNNDDILQQLPNWPYPVHEAFHQMLQFYSTGLLVVAAMITIYFAITVIAETAQSGTPFGRRFNKVWAPIRIVVAFGLLIPITNGLNSAQYIVLYAAKYGSGFATNGWTQFNASLSNNIGANTNTLIAKPSPPELSGLMQFFYVARICGELYKGRFGEEVLPYIVKSGVAISSLPLTTITYDEMLEFADGSNKIIVRYGTAPDPETKEGFIGFIKPQCGELVYSVTDPRDPSSTTNPPSDAATTLQSYYYGLIRALWTDPTLVDMARSTADSISNVNIDEPGYISPTDPDPAIRQMMQELYAADFEARINTAVAEFAAEDRLTVQPELIEKGWAGAAIWYNRIAELNGDLVTMVHSAPTIRRYPEVMEQVAYQKAQQNQNVGMENRFNPNLANGDDIQIASEVSDFTKPLWVGYKFFSEGGAKSTHTDPTGEPFSDFINAVFGTSGLFDMADNTDIHPLGQLAGVGRSLIESAVRNLGASVVASSVGVVAALTSDGKASKTSAISQAAIGLFMTAAIVGMTAGFILFYVVPFLPFIYFFFALGGWIKGIFEAMIGAPLWALAHIRIDGPGLPGQAAMAGYYLIFEIFLRPILIIFGLIASISTFSALVQVLHDTWALVTSNLTGFNVEGEFATPGLVDYFRGPVDEFFFTIVYVLVVYIMGMASFKMIDLIPNQILRWVGQSVATFNDQREDAAQSLMGTASVGGQQATQAIGGGLQTALSQAPAAAAQARAS